MTAGWNLWLSGRSAVPFRQGQSDSCAPTPKTAPCDDDKTGKIADFLNRRQQEADGKVSYLRCDSKYDGKDYPVSTREGAASGLTVARKRLNSRTIEATFKLNGKLRNQDRWVVTSDRNRLMLRSRRADPRTGEEYTTISVFEPQ